MSNAIDGSVYVFKLGQYWFACFPKEQTTEITTVNPLYDYRPEDEVCKLPECLPPDFNDPDYIEKIVLLQ